MRLFEADRTQIIRRLNIPTEEKTDGKIRHRLPNQVSSNFLILSFLREWLSASGWQADAGERARSLKRKEVCSR